MTSVSCSKYLQPYIDDLHKHKKCLSKIKAKLDKCCTEQTKVPTILQDELTDCLQNIKTVQKKMKEHGERHRKSQQLLHKRKKSHSNSKLSNSDFKPISSIGQMYSSINVFTATSSSNDTSPSSTNSLDNTPTSFHSRASSSLKPKKSKRLSNIQKQLDARINQTIQSASHQ